MKTHLRGHCVFCDCERTFVCRPFDHALNLSLTLASLGAWAPVWLCLFIDYCVRRGHRCCWCHHRARRPLRSEDAAAQDAAALRQLQRLMAAPRTPADARTHPVAARPLPL